MRWYRAQAGERQGASTCCGSAVSKERSGWLELTSASCVSFSRVRLPGLWLFWVVEKLLWRCLSDSFTDFIRPSRARRLLSLAVRRSRWMGRAAHGNAVSRAGGLLVPGGRGVRGDMAAAPAWGRTTGRAVRMSARRAGLRVSVCRERQPVCAGSRTVG